MRIVNCNQWRYLLFFTLLASEVYLVLSPSSFEMYPNKYVFVDTLPPTTTFLHFLFPERTVYEHVLFLRQIFIFLSVAMSRVLPVLFPFLAYDELGMDFHMAKNLCERLVKITKDVDKESKFSAILI